MHRSKWIPWPAGSFNHIQEHNFYKEKANDNTFFCHKTAKSSLKFELEPTSLHDTKTQKELLISNSCCSNQKFSTYNSNNVLFETFYTTLLAISKIIILFSFSFSTRTIPSHSTLTPGKSHKPTLCPRFFALSESKLNWTQLNGEKLKCRE